MATKTNTAGASSAPRREAANKLWAPSSPERMRPSGRVLTVSRGSKRGAHSQVLQDRDPRAVPRLPPHSGAATLAPMAEFARRVRIAFALVAEPALAIA